MSFRYSRHALEEMARRRIPQPMVDAVLANPQQVDFGGGRIFLLRAIVAEDVQPNLVVTVYRTSKIRKYWRTP